MNKKQFDNLVRSLGELTVSQRSALAQALEEASAPDEVLQIINARAERCRLCPGCGSTSAYRWGFRAGVQRYRCKQCGRTYTALSASPLAHLKRKDAWLKYLEAMKQGLSVRKAADAAGINMTTAFRWRHRMLIAPSQQKDREMDGIVEADETYFLESYKGSRSMPRESRKRGGKAKKHGLSAEQIPVLVVRDRLGHHFDAVLSEANIKNIGLLLPQLLSDQSVLCSDGAYVYKWVAKSFGIPHESLNLSKGLRIKKRIFHVQNVNAYDSRLKRWMERFNGVATKYLPNYLGWRRMLDRQGSALTPPSALALALG